MGREQKGSPQEQPINPEVVWGRKFMVPAIIGLGSGRGFEFSGLHLPRGWEKAIPKLREINPANFQFYLDRYCAWLGFKPGLVKIDSMTGVLREITVETEPVSQLYLATNFPKEQDGLYEAKDVNNLEVAIILQRVAVTFLGRLSLELGREQLYPYIDGQRGGYYSCDLKVPEEFLESKEPVTNPYYQRSFELRASNIAGRFGLTLRTISFDEGGLLRSFDVKEGDACGYYLDRGLSRGYNGHNVDSAQQVAVLHGIAASFINDLLWRKDE